VNAPAVVHSPVYHKLNLILLLMGLVLGLGGTALSFAGGGGLSLTFTATAGVAGEMLAFYAGLALLCEKGGIGSN